MKTDTIQASQVHAGAVVVLWRAKFMSARHVHEVTGMLNVLSIDGIFRLHRVVVNDQAGAALAG
jgi:hypothetical protein